MMTVLVAMMLAGSSEPKLRQAGPDGKIETRYCRAAISAKQRGQGYLVCRTRAEWVRWEECQRATRYCPPGKLPAAMTVGKNNTAFALSEDSKIVCRPIKVTGTRLYTQQICLPKREWQRLWDESKATVADMQDFSSKVPGEQ